MKYLGKIEKVKFGNGGYQDAEIGLTLSFLYGTFGSRKSIVTFMKEMGAVGDALKSAGFSDLFDLHGKPVEVEIEDDKLVSWRILSEVL